MNYFKYLALINLFFVINIIKLSHATTEVQSNNSIEIQIKSLKYEKPALGIGISGELIFDNLNFYRDGLFLQFNNKDSIFNSKIFLRPGFIGISGPHTGLGFSITADGPIMDILKLTSTNSEVIINDRFFQLSGESTLYKSSLTEFMVSRFNYQCKGHPDFDSTSAEGIIAGCLTDSKFSPTTFKNTFKTEKLLSISYNSSDKSNPLSLESMVEEIEIKGSKIKANIPKLDLSYDIFKIQADKIQFRCKKDPKLITLDTEVLVNTCLQEVNLISPNISIIDQKEKSQFIFDSEKFKISAKKTFLSSYNFKFLDSEGETDVRELKIDCSIDTPNKIFDYSDMIDQCVNHGDISMKKIFNTKFRDNKKLSELYTSLLKGSKGFLGKKEETGIKNMHFKIRDHYFKFTAKVKIWPTYHKINASGVITRGPNKEIIIDIRKTKLPLWIKSKSIFLYFFKKYLVSKTVQVKNDKIYIII